MPRLLDKYRLLRATKGLSRVGEIASPQIWPTINIGSYPAAPSNAGDSSFITWGQSNCTPFTTRFTGAASANARMWSDWTGVVASPAWVNSEHFWAAHLGQDLNAARGVVSYQHIRAEGASNTKQWLPGTAFYNELMQNITEAIAAQAGTEPQFIAVYIGESMASSAALLSAYAPDVAHILDAIRLVRGYIPTLVVQVGRRTTLQAEMNNAREEQRKMHQPYGTSYAAYLPNVWVCPSWDLELGTDDTVHLAGTSGDTLGERLALMARQYVYGDSVDAEIPTVTGITAISNVLTEVTFNRQISTDGGDNYSNSFSVYNNGVAVSLSSAVRKAGNSSVIQLSHATIAGTRTVSCQPDFSATKTVRLANVPKATNGMPTLAFEKLGLF